MEDQTPIENNPPLEAKAPESTPPESASPENQPAPKSKLLLGATVAIALVMGLYFVNRPLEQDVVGLNVSVHDALVVDDHQPSVA